MAAIMTANAIAAMNDDDLNRKPVVEVVEVKLISSAQERYRMIVSDGVETQQALLASQLNPLVKSGRLQKGSVVQMLEYIANTVQGRRFDDNFQEFCSQVVFECVSKDRPSLLQVYLFLYTVIGSMWEQVTSSRIAFHDSLFLSSLKLALAYNDTQINGKLSCTNGAMIQSTFIESLTFQLPQISSDLDHGNRRESHAMQS